MSYDGWINEIELLGYTNVSEDKEHKVKNCFVYSATKGTKQKYIVISFEPGYPYDIATLTEYNEAFKKKKAIDVQFV